MCDGRWRSEASCLGEDPNVFFPDVYESNRNARSVCACCPVRTDCLDYAISHHIGFGIWGGMTPRERHYEARARRTMKARPA